MTFAEYETSEAASSPVELYEFSNSFIRYLYTSQANSVPIGDDLYKAVPISRNSIIRDGEVSKANIIVTVPFQTDIAQIFSIQPPPNVVTLSVYRYHTADGVANKVLYWSGRITSSKWKGEVVEFACESIYSSIQRYGVTRSYQPSCPYVLYQGKCPAVAGNHVIVRNILAIDKSTITLSSIGKPDNYLTGGYVDYTTAFSLVEARSIADHTGDVITLAYSIPGLQVGNEMKLFPGCNRTMDHCLNRFSALDDFGGFPYVPSSNPFDGSMLF